MAGAPDRSRSRGQPPRRRRDELVRPNESDEQVESEDGGPLDESRLALDRSLVRFTMSNPEGGKIDTRMVGTSTTVVTVTGIAGITACAGFATYHPEAYASVGVSVAAIVVIVGMYIRRVGRR